MGTRSGRASSIRGAAIAWLACILLCASPGITCGRESAEADPAVASGLPTQSLVVAGKRIDVEVAATPQARMRGLMFRESLPPDRGMIFVHPQDQILAFWMRNTKIPLSIAFANRDGVIVRIADMVPFSEDSVSSVFPARYALEMNVGWFARNGVRAGDRIEGLPEAPAR